MGWLLAAAAVIGLAQAAGAGPPPAVARAGPVFTALLIPHIVAGLTALSSGAVLTLARKDTGWHQRAGTTYLWAITLLTATAAGLTAVRGTRDLPVLGLGLLAWHSPPPDGTPSASPPPGCGGPGPGTGRTSWP